MQFEHTSKQYDAELESVRAKVLEMGGLVEQQIVNALEALTNADIKLAPVILEQGDHIQHLLEYYMGKNTPERQEFIINNLKVELDKANDTHSI